MFNGAPGNIQDNLTGMIQSFNGGGSLADGVNGISSSKSIEWI